MPHQSPGGRHPVELLRWREFRRGGSVVWRLRIHCPTEEEIHQWMSAGSDEGAILAKEDGLAACSPAWQSLGNLSLLRKVMMPETRLKRSRISLIGTYIHMT